MSLLIARFNLLISNITSEFIRREPWRYIKYAFRARVANAERAKDIYRQRGVGWAVGNLLPGWLPGKTGVIEFMHAVYLGIVFLFLTDDSGYSLIQPRSDGQAFDQKHSIQDWNVQLSNAERLPAA